MAHYRSEARARHSTGSQCDGCGALLGVPAAPPHSSPSLGLYAEPSETGNLFRVNPFPSRTSVFLTCEMGEYKDKTKDSEKNTPKGNNPARHLEPRRCLTTPLLSPHPPTPHEFTGSAEDDQGEDSCRGLTLVTDPTDQTAGRPEQAHCPTICVGWDGGWDRG